uniref:Hepcidin isoform 2 n=1 Tax=Oplegnathus fasciatus TaxID=163134 RepID=B5A4A6_OPLFA|nr:hepcidin isoform 2 [Oplegnathus fasciatus]ACF49397.1 hepcidin isoform 4 [Oplegnathus fasciatus]ACF49399.1 hepcidin isoform 2 [Oplegnathus fasciatus]ACF49401.1 hepcidin isoform 4 [Oplegnathus fasciatus]
MKTFSVAVAVAVVLTFICLQESSAVSVTEQQVQELEEPMSNDNPAAAHEEMSEESWKMPYNNRQKRGFKCKFCCGCCRRGVCGLCCRF